MNTRAGPLLATLLLLAGCAAPPAAPPPAGETTAEQAQALWRQHREKVSAIAGWDLKGKMAVKTGRRGGNATLLWAYRPADEKIELYGPFGSGRVRIIARPGHAVLKDTKGKTIESATAADALYQRLGWQVPFEELRYWVRGIPDSGVDTSDSHITLDAAGRLKTLQQGNWRVEYLDYNQVGGLVLPGKLAISALPGTMEIYARNGEYIGDQLNVKVILKRWQDIRFAE